MTPAEARQEIKRRIGGYIHDPLGFVEFAFPWGVPGRGLENDEGPREWQREILSEIGERLRAPHEPGTSSVIRIAVASGHGIGKSALMAMIKLWALSTFPDTVTMITANTEQQVRTKTWPQIVKWFNMMICRDWFNITDTSITSAAPGKSKTWRGDRVTWSENNTDAFAGLHNLKKRIVLLYDEASSIADRVWEVSEGALTDADTEIIWIVFGNPTQNTGRFRECFGRLRERWSGRQIDSRTVPGTNLEQIAQWAEDYGEDHDFMRVRVKGQFPRASAMQFIGNDLVEGAQKREATSNITDPLIIGVDVARQGDDQTVILCRKGRDARTIKTVKLRTRDLMVVASKVYEIAQANSADAVMVDVTGMGYGVADRLRQLHLPNVFDVHFGGASDWSDSNIDPMACANKAAEIWATMRWWLKGGAIADDMDLHNDLVGRLYGYDKDNRITLEKKEDMKKRGLSSPDNADALALTFSYPVTAHQGAGIPGRERTPGRMMSDYDPYAEQREGQSYG